ncbi:MULTISPECIES: HTH domain-containing protein [Clostridium]
MHHYQIINFTKDANSITYENKYKLAVANLFLHFFG